MDPKAAARLAAQRVTSLANLIEEYEQGILLDSAADPTLQNHAQKVFSNLMVRLGATK